MAKTGGRNLGAIGFSIIDHCSGPQNDDAAVGGTVPIRHGMCTVAFAYIMLWLEGSLSGSGGLARQKVQERCDFVVVCSGLPFDCRRTQ